MAFIEEWQTRLDNSLAAFAQLATTTDDIDFTYGILATAVLWPTRRALQDYDPDAIAAVRQASASTGKALKLILTAVEDWKDDRLAAAKSLATATHTAPELRPLLDKLIAHFDAGTRFAAHLVQAHLSSASSGPARDQTFEIAEQIKAALVNIGGFTNIQALTVHLDRSEPVPAPPPSEIKHFEPETVYIPAGTFLMGSEAGPGIPDHETPQFSLDLPSYRIGKYPVTNRQYAEFLRRTRGHEAPPGWHGFEPPPGEEDHPVAGVSWHDARAYCAWLTGVTETGGTYTLPSEAQWEKAARGTKGRVYPWGDDWDADNPRCNLERRQTTPVDAFPEGVSPYGCFDMVGNVREWTCTLWGHERLKPDEQFRYPWSKDEHNDDDGVVKVRRTYRGRGERGDPSPPRASIRGSQVLDQRGPRGARLGFRVVLLGADN